MSSFRTYYTIRLFFMLFGLPLTPLARSFYQLVFFLISILMKATSGIPAYYHHFCCVGITSPPLQRCYHTICSSCSKRGSTILSLHHALAELPATASSPFSILRALSLSLLLPSRSLSLPPQVAANVNTMNIHK